MGGKQSQLLVRLTWTGLLDWTGVWQQILSITKAKLLGRPNILITSIHHNFCTIFCIFWTPCMARIAFYSLGLSIFEKKLPKCSTSEKQNFSGDPIFWSCPYISFFFHQNMLIFIFWTPCMAKIAFYWLGLSIFEKGSQNAPHQKGKTFQETQYFDQALKKCTSGAPLLK